MILNKDYVGLKAEGFASHSDKNRVLGDTALQT